MSSTLCPAFVHRNIYRFTWHGSLRHFCIVATNSKVNILATLQVKVRSKDLIEQRCHQSKIGALKSITLLVRSIGIIESIYAEATSSLAMLPLAYCVTIVCFSLYHIRVFRGFLNIVVVFDVGILLWWMQYFAARSTPQKGLASKLVRHRKFFIILNLFTTEL